MEYQKFEGNYEKIYYDILLKDGKEIKVTYPNADMFHSLDNESVLADDVEMFKPSFLSEEEEAVFFEHRYEKIKDSGMGFKSFANMLPFDLPVLKYKSTPSFSTVAVKKHWRLKPSKPHKYQADRNSACPCGSGKKFKKCCIDAQE